MEPSHRFQFKAITRLRLFDVKAQKKTIPFKKFCSIPLTYEETLKENFQSFKNAPLEYNQPSEYPLRKSKTLANLKRFSQPKLMPLKTAFQNERSQEKMKEIDKIMKKCGNEMRKGNKFLKKWMKIEKHSQKCLNMIQRRVEFIISEGTNTFGYR